MSNDLLMEPEAQCTLVSNKTLWRTPVKVEKNKQVICDVSMLCCYCITAGGHRLVTGEQTNSQVGPNKVLLKTVIQRLSWQLQGIKVATTIFFLLLFLIGFLLHFQVPDGLKSEIGVHTNSRAMYVKRAAATISRTRDQGNQNPRFPKLNLKIQKDRNKTVAAASCLFKVCFMVCLVSLIHTNSEQNIKQSSTVDIYTCGQKLQHFLETVVMNL